MAYVGIPVFGDPTGSTKGRVGIPTPPVDNNPSFTKPAAPSFQVPPSTPVPAPQEPPQAAPLATIPQPGYGVAPHVVHDPTADPAGASTLDQYMAMQHGAAASPADTAVDQSQWLGTNPQLVQYQGKGIDALYVAQEAQLRANTARQYNDLLQQLGFTGPNGQFIKGDVEIAADRATAENLRNMGLAHEGVTQDSQRSGTLFSGYRGTQTARAEHPFVQTLADLAVDVPKQLSRLYQQAENTLQDYTIQQNVLLAEAALRALGIATHGGTPGGTSTKPPPDDTKTDPTAGDPTTAPYTPSTGMGNAPDVFFQPGAFPGVSGPVYVDPNDVNVGVPDPGYTPPPIFK